MDPKQLSLLKQIMEIGFCAMEISLYLDTHPNDEMAIRLHNTFTKQYRDLVEMYNREYDMLTLGAYSTCPWEWIESPWPWEIDYSKC